MARVTRNTIAVGFFALGVSLSTIPAQAEIDPLPGLTNLNFLSQNPGGSPAKNSFTSFDPAGWTGGNGLIAIDQPGDSTNENTACGSGKNGTIQTYGCPGPLSIAGGYNYVQADGNPHFESGFNYVVSGLTAGTEYSLSFYQGASQQLGFASNLNTTEQWIVSLGTSGLTATENNGPADPYYGGNDSTYSNADGTASIATTPVMTTPPGGLTDWQFVTVNLVADAETDTLSFLAWGDNGDTINLPPMVFLAGVNSAAGLNAPEPASIALLASGLFGLGVAAVRRRRKV